MLATNAAGAFSRAALAPGLYTVEVVLVGFRSHTAVHQKAYVARVTSSPPFALELDLETDVVVVDGRVSRVPTMNAEVTSIFSIQSPAITPCN